MCVAFVTSKFCGPQKSWQKIVGHFFAFSAIFRPSIVELLREFGLTVSERNTETLLMRVKEKQPAPPPPPLSIEAAGQRYAQTAEFRYLGGLVKK